MYTGGWCAAKNVKFRQDKGENSMTGTKNENGLSHVASEMQEERELSEELRAFMEEEARSVSPGLDTEARLP